VRPRLSLLLATALLALAAAAPASADVYDDFRDDGQINPCQYTDGQLQEGLNGLPPDVLQYSPGLADQLAAGREGCGGGAPGSAADTRSFETVPGIAGSSGGPGAGATPQARIPDPPAPEAGARARLAQTDVPSVSATTRAEDPGWVMALLVAAGLAGVIALVVRFTGVGADGLLRPLRGAFADAGGRTADAMAQVWDSVRLGR